MEEKRNTDNLSPLARKNMLESLGREELERNLTLMDKDTRKRVWPLLSVERICSVLSDSPSAPLFFQELSLKAQCEVIKRLEMKCAENLLLTLTEEERRVIISMSGREFPPRFRYSEDEIGSITSEDFIALDKDITAGKALEEIRKEAETKDNIRTILLQGESGELFGEADLLDVLRTKGDVPLSSVALTSFPFVPATAQISKTIEWIREYNLSSFPVIDEEGRIIGVVPRQRLLDTVRRELEEDYRRLASLEDDGSTKGVLLSMRARLPWLFLLLALGILVSACIGSLSSLALGLTLVFSFQSLILDMTGNSGTQTLAVVVRALSGRELPKKEKRRLLKKETESGITAGLILGGAAVLFLFPYIFLRSSMGAGYSFTLSLSIAASLVISMTVSNAVGCAIPMLLDRFSVDPAVASGPLITTFNDLVGAASYYLVVYILIRKVLGF